MIIIGAILLVLGILTGISILTILGVVILVAGAILMLVSFAPAAAGPRPWYRRRYY